MSKPIGIMLLIVLWVCPYLHMLGSPGAAEMVKTTALSPPGATFGGTFRRMIGANPTTLDPARVTDIYGGAVVRQIFDGLIQFDANLKPVPDLAEFWQASRDGLIWTFTLRRGVKFHHGREVTAADVVYSLTRLLDASRPLPVTDLLQTIRGAKAFMQGQTASVPGLEAVDRYTVKVMLHKPLAPFLAMLGLANTFVVPQDEVERLGDAFGRSPVGTGPFEFAYWQPHREIGLAANAQYYEGRPFLDAVIFKIIDGARSEETFAEFLKGNLEETIIPSGTFEAFKTDSRYQRYQIVRKPMLDLVYIGFNTRLKPFDDRRVRQAFNHAVNVDAIVRTITQRDSRVAASILPPGMPGYDPEMTGYAYDPAKAKRLLAEAGYAGGAGIPAMQLWSVHKAASTRAELAAYQAYLAAVGVQVEIRFADDWGSYKALLEQGKLPMFRLLWSADIPDPDNFLSPLLQSRSSTNRTFYRNTVVDQLLEQARHTLDEAQRIKLYREVQRLVTNDAPWITQHHSVLNYLYQPYVRGVEASLLGKRGIPLKAVWFQTRP